MLQVDVNRLATHYALDVDCIRFGTKPGACSVKVFRDYDQPRYLEGHIVQEGSSEYSITTAAYEHRRMTPLVEQTAPTLEHAFALAAKQFDLLEGKTQDAEEQEWSTHQVVRASSWIDALQAKISERSRAATAAFTGGNPSAWKYWSEWCIRAEGTVARIQMRLNGVN